MKDCGAVAGQAVELDRSDPNLELLYSFALRSAGKEQEALAAIKDALPHGRPAGGVTTPVCRRSTQGAVPRSSPPS